MRLIDADALKEKAFGKRGGLIHTEDIDAASTIEERTNKRTETHACDLISRQAAIDEIRKCRFVVDAIEKIRGLPSAQPEVIRCKDCKHNSNTGGNYTTCDVLPQMFGRNPEDNYCSYAERREP